MAKAITQFEKVMMTRDHMNSTQAKEELLRAREEITEMIEDGMSYDDVADALACDYGLEMDYIFDILG